jgi:hypothetical protein
MSEIDQALSLPLRTMKWTTSETGAVTATRFHGPATASSYRQHKWAKSTPGEGAG